jgi:hypothetical protein
MPSAKSSDVSAGLGAPPPIATSQGRKRPAWSKTAPLWLPLSAASVGAVVGDAVDPRELVYRANGTATNPLKMKLRPSGHSDNALRVVRQNHGILRDGVCATATELWPLS